MFSCFGHIFVVIDRFERSLRFYHLELNKEAISDGCRSENTWHQWDFWILRYFKELSFCDPCGPCITIYYYYLY